jgi:hypothetical protein
MVKFSIRTRRLFRWWQAPNLPPLTFDEGLTLASGVTLFAATVIAMPIQHAA